MAQRRRCTGRAARCLGPALLLVLLGHVDAPRPGASVLVGDAVQEQTVQETYRRQCAACHGSEGRGDGRAARRHNPRPPDFTDPESVVKLTDDELIEIIIEGRASMPAFGDVLSEAVIIQVVSYIRDMSRGDTG